MCICLHDTFFSVKKSQKWELREWGFIFCFRFRHQFFKAYRILRFWDFEKKIFFLIQILGCYRKMRGLFPCTAIFRGGFLIKKCKKNVYPRFC